MIIHHVLPAIGKVPVENDRNGAGGISSGTLSLANEQGKRGHEVSIFSWSPSEEKSYVTEYGVHVHYLTAWEWARFYRWDLRWLLPVTRKLLLKRPDILHVHSDPNLLLASNAKARVFHIRTPVPKQLNSSYKRLVQQSQAIICNSRFTAQAFKAVNQYPEEHVHVVHNAADERFFINTGEKSFRRKWGIDDNTFVVAFAGALVPEKGVSHAIAAIRKALQHIDSIILVVIGDTALWPTIDQPQGMISRYVEDLKRSSGHLPVKFVGSLSRNEMPSGLAAADVILVPSIWDEPFGTVACESMAVGKPVIAYESGGIVEIVSHMQTGWIVPKSDIDGLAAAIVTLAKESQIRTQMSVAAKKHALAGFTWDVAATKLDAVYEKILCKKD